MRYARIFMYGVLGLALISAGTLPAGAATKVDVAMVLWRGVTEAEMGFQARLKQAKEYDFDFTIYDASQD